MRFKLGKKPARPGAIKLKFGTFFDKAALPTPPMVFGHTGHGGDLRWGMLANDEVSNCVFAGGAHEHMVWTHVHGGQPARFNNAGVIADYSAVTGYDPKRPETDQGTDMVQAAKYRQRTGLIDADGVRHKIEAYVELDIGNVDQVVLAAYLTGAVGIGVQLPESCEKQFDHQEPFTIVKGSRNEGGHYVPLVGRNSHGNPLIVTWGRIQAVTPAWLAEQMDEGVAYIALEYLANNLSPEGFDSEYLRKSIARLAA